jgi:hypothetical protein
MFSISNNMHGPEGPDPMVRALLTTASTKRIHQDTSRAQASIRAVRMLHDIIMDDFIDFWNEQAE